MTNTNTHPAKKRTVAISPKKWQWSGMPSELSHSPLLKRLCSSYVCIPFSCLLPFTYSLLTACLAWFLQKMAGKHLQELSREHAAAAPFWGPSTAHGHIYLCFEFTLLWTTVASCPWPENTMASLLVSLCAVPKVCSAFIGWLGALSH